MLKNYEIFLISFYETNVSLMSKLEKDIMRKKNYKTIVIMTIKAKIIKNKLPK